MTISLCWIGFKKSMASPVRVLLEQILVHKPNEYDFVYINKPTCDSKIRNDILIKKSCLKNVKW